MGQTSFLSPMWLVKVLHPFFFSGVTLMECCRVDDTSPENPIVGLAPSWVDTDVCRLYIVINPPQPGGTRAPSRSPPVSWWSERRTNSSVMILPGILACHMAKEAESSCFKDTWNWRATGSLPDRSVGNVLTCRVYGIRRIFWRDHVSKASSRDIPHPTPHKIGHFGDALPIQSLN